VSICESARGFSPGVSSCRHSGCTHDGSNRVVQFHPQPAERRSFISGKIVLMPMHNKPEMPETQSRPLEVKRKVRTARKECILADV